MGACGLSNLLCTGEKKFFCTYPAVNWRLLITLAAVCCMVSSALWVMKGFWVPYTVCWRIFWAPCCVLKGLWAPNQYMYVGFVLKNFLSLCFCTAERFLSTLAALCWQVFSNLLCDKEILSTLLCTHWRVFQYTLLCTRWRVFRALQGFWVPHTLWVEKFENPAYAVLCNLLCAEGFLSTLLCTRWRVFQYPSCVHAEEFFSTLRGFDWEPYCELKGFWVPCCAMKGFLSTLLCTRWRVFQYPEGFWVLCCELERILSTLLCTRWRVLPCCVRIEGYCPAVYMLKGFFSTYHEYPAVSWRDFEHLAEYTLKGIALLCTCWRVFQYPDWFEYPADSWRKIFFEQPAVYTLKGSALLCSVGVTLDRMFLI